MLTRFRTLALAGLAAAAAAVLAAPPASAQASQEPLARFEDPICPGIAGFSRVDAEVMVGRIRQNLEGFGRRLAPAGACEPNLRVIIVDDGADFMRRVARLDRRSFDDLNRYEREELMRSGDPARTLLRVLPRSRDGVPLPRHEDLTNPPQTAMWMAHSKIYTATRNDIVAAMIVFEREAIRDLTIGQLADYVTFRALTRTLPQTAEARSASILSLFEGGSARPAGLTEFDQAYLAALYQGPPNLRGTNRLAEMERATGPRAFRQ